jgi:hypothetical protein
MPEVDMFFSKLSFLAKFLISFFLLAGSFQAKAFVLDFTITHGVVCPITESCSFAYYDPAGSFQGDVQPDGSMLFAAPIEFTFNGDSQGFSMVAQGGGLTASASNGPVTDGVIPEGNWDGVLQYTTSLGGTGDFILDSSNSSYSLFIDNFDKSFTLSVGDPYGANTPGNAGIGASFTVLGTIELASAVVPVPAAAWLFASGLFGLVGVARRKK